MRYNYVFKVALSFMLAMIIFTFVFRRTVSAASLIVILVTCIIANLVFMRRE